jgi:diguanylate cyclase (GGDEF)-like protein
MTSDGERGSPSERLETGLSRLREGFVYRIPDRVADLAAQWRDLLDGQWSHDGARTLHRSVHGLMGTAGSLGLAEVSDAALRLERQLVGVLDSDRPPTPKRAAEISTLIERVAQAPVSAEPVAPHTRTAGGERSEPPPPFEPRNLIVIVEIEGEFARELAAQLGYFGFELQMCERMDELSSISGERRPAAVILDLSAPAGENLGVEAAVRVRETFSPQVPIVFVSNRSDVAARLEAVRAGCSGYFVKPVDFAEIVTTLDRITRSEPEAYRILIIDDEREAAAFHAAALEAAGMATVSVIDPLDVMAQLVEFQPDVILMDVYMPTCSGLELAAVIRQKEAFVAVPIVFLSRETDRMKQIAALGEGGDDFFPKPIPPDQLVAAVAARAQRGRTLRQFMERDGLTGLSTHSRIVEQLESAIRRAERHGDRLAVAMLDIDGFKRINDSYGHLAGDQVLKALAYLLRQRLRLSDFIGRFGGDEYLVVLPDTDGAAAQRTMDDIRENFASVEHDTGDTIFGVTLSAGVAEYPDAATSHQLISAADKALYRAKRAGRDRVFQAGSEER